MLNQFLFVVRMNQASGSFLVEKEEILTGLVVVVPFLAVTMVIVVAGKEVTTARNKVTGLIISSSLGGRVGL